MIVAEYTTTTHATPEAVWRFCGDPKTWPVWDPAMEYVQFDGTLHTGATGMLKVKQGPKVFFTVSQCNEPYLFVTVNKWPGARLVFTHQASKTNGVTTIVNRIELHGFLKYVYRLLVGRAMQKGLPIAVDNLIKLAEKS